MIRSGVDDSGQYYGLIINHASYGSFTHDAPLFFFLFSRFTIFFFHLHGNHHSTFCFICFAKINYNLVIIQDNSSYDDLRTTPMMAHTHTHSSLKAIAWTKLNKYNWISIFETLIQIQISVASFIVPMKRVGKFMVKEHKTLEHRKYARCAKVVNQFCSFYKKNTTHTHTHKQQIVLI